MNLFTEGQCDSFLPFHEDTFVRVRRCIDGESFMALFTFNNEPKKIVIKLKGYTCRNRFTGSEEEREAARKMKQQLEDLILEKIVKLTSFHTDKLESSLLADVYVADKCINNEMIRIIASTETIREEKPSDNKTGVIAWIGRRLRL